MIKRFKFDPFKRTLVLDPHAEFETFSQSLSDALPGSSTTTVSIPLGRPDYDEAEFILAVNTGSTSVLFCIFVFCTRSDNDAFSFADTVVNTVLSPSYNFADWRTVGLSKSDNGLLSRSIFATANSATPYLAAARINGSNLELDFANASGTPGALNHNIFGTAFRRCQS